jgi:plasmid stabilization system protein ParE
MKVVIADAAEIDLEKIGDDIAMGSPRRALTFTNELRASCEALSEMPRAFPVAPMLPRSNIRRRVHGNYLIFFRIGVDRIDVIRILHGAMNYAEILLGDDITG